MCPRIRQLVQKHGPEASRFVIVGLLATAIHYGIYLLLERGLGINRAYSIGYAVSLAFNYILSNYFTFKTQPSLAKSVGFCASHAVNYGLHIGLLNLFVFYGVPEKIAPAFVFMIAIPVNYVLVRHVLKRWK